MKDSITDFAEILGEMNGGVLVQQAGTAASDIAANICAIDKKRKGKLTIELEFERIGDSNQVSIKHKIKTLVPKPRGKVSEEIEGETPFHVGPRGKITLFPNAQTSLELGAGAATGRTDGVRTP
jgi:hypothetical protein